MKQHIVMNPVLHATVAAARPPVAPYHDPAADALDGEDETILIRRSQSGDVDAFNELVERYQRQLFAVACRMLGDADDAADALQESFLAAYRNIRSYRGGTFGAWLTRIAVNKCYDLLRVRRRREQFSLDDTDGPGQTLVSQLADPSEPTDERIVRNELAGALERAVRALPADQRLAVILSDIQGQSYEEIVAATGWPIGTLKSRLSRARARLRGTIRQEQDVPESPLFVAPIDQRSDRNWRAAHA